ncbi:MAG: uroporphyrinogen decarboxylase family protein [Butyricicoccus pullicaecorum]|nr:uroporphyrinogen decarboxylase family protein [Butyricicoccus pullicaecorum]
MKRNMNEWKDAIIASPIKKAMPILSFPAIQLMGISVKELISNSETQASAMKLLADRNDSLAAVSMMDLSVEAETFGSKIQVNDHEVPVVLGSIVKTQEDADALEIPEIGAGRTQIYIDAMKRAVELIEDRPVLAGVIGPFSLAGRLIGTVEIMKACKRKPEMVHSVMEKCTQFLISYINAYRKTGANGIVMAEPLTGLLSPKLAVAFSEPYVKRIVDAVQTDDFIVLYHNCGNNTLLMMDSILRVGAEGYHFGNAICMEEAVALCPPDVLCMGNVDPASFAFGTPESIAQETTHIMSKCCHAPNFIISSGCDIPPIASWDNIAAFYQAVSDFYTK